MKQPFFSIVIPTLNEELYIFKLINSLEKQTYKNFEVLVVDGFSEDATAKVVHSLQKQSLVPLHFFQIKKHNVSLQRNYGAEKANGDYLVFFDADVFVSPDYLEKLFKKLQESSYDFASTQYVPDTKNVIDKTVIFFLNILFYLSFKTSKPWMSGQNIIMKKSVFTALNGFDPTVIHAEDFDLAGRAKRQGYRGTIFLDIVHFFSTRRIKREGRIKLLLKYSKSVFHVLFIGPIRKPLFNYPMGGKALNENN